MNKNLENQYQKKTQREHILLRPDTYIGSIESIKSKQWVYNDELHKMEFKLIDKNDGLYKIFMKF